MSIVPKILPADEAEWKRLGAALLRAWRIELDEVEQARQRGELSDDALDAIMAPCGLLVDQIADMTAQGFAGLGVKALALAWCKGIDPRAPQNCGVMDDAILASIAHDAMAFDPQMLGQPI